MQNETPVLDIKAIIGLGNPGKQYYHHRHSIGFRIVDAMAQKYDDNLWRERDNMEFAEIIINDHKVLLVKPQTFMNASGKVVPYLLKQGIKPENILVVHDELEYPFGKIKIRFGGSHRGHNGLKSIAALIGLEFPRLRFGIGRPEEKSDVSKYVLENFENPAEVDRLILQAVEIIEKLF